MNDIILFAGTTEGRKIAEACRNQNLTLYVSTATEYGEALIEAADNIHVLHGRKEEAEITSLIEKTGAKLIIDATHPYASKITETLRGICEKKQVEYLRVVRSETHEDTESCVFVNDAEKAAEYLNTVQGNVLLTVGSKELAKFTAVTDYGERLFARILSLPEAVLSAASLGFTGRHLICMQGPFSEELNEAMLRDTNARYLVTKDTGAQGGFPEKIRAAKACGVTPVVIRRPLKEEGVSVRECLSILGRRYGFCFRLEKQVTILGVGTGNAGTMTTDAEKACREAELLVGSKRVLSLLSRFGKETKEAILPQEIAEIIGKSSAGKIVAAMSGDTGFYSGAKKLLPLLSDDDVTVLPGISSVSAFCSRIGTSWDDAVLLSAHGRACNIVSRVRKNPKVILLAGGEGGVSNILHTLTEFGFSDVRVTVGENISYENERIREGTAEELSEQAFDSLSILLIENPEAEKCVVTSGRPDGDFLRSEVPMTKQEVRAVTLSKLRLTKSATCWDVGAGTGSVSLEMAECCEDGIVYAVEKKEDACSLIEENKRHLGVTNLQVVFGEAPDCLAALPAPTHVFVGGSSGNLQAILLAALEKNPAVRIVLNTVTAETFAEAVTALKTLPVKNPEIVQLNVSRSRKVGPYQMMTAQNPVSVISFDGGSENG